MKLGLIQIMMSWDWEAIEENPIILANPPSTNKHEEKLMMSLCELNKDEITRQNFDCSYLKNPSKKLAKTSNFYRSFKQVFSNSILLVGK